MLAADEEMKTSDIKERKEEEEKESMRSLSAVTLHGTSAAVPNINEPTSLTGQGYVSLRPLYHSQRPQHVVVVT